MPTTLQLVQAMRNSHYRGETFYERFMGACVAGPNDCIIMTRHDGGDRRYPTIAFEAKGQRYLRRASHVALAFEGIEVPPGKIAMHSCDNTKCVNKHHLSVATHEDNMADMVAKGRSMQGQKHRDAKLTAEQVLEIRAKGQDNPILVPLLACRYGVSKATIRNILAGRKWRHL